MPVFPHASACRRSLFHSGFIGLFLLLSLAACSKPAILPATTDSIVKKYDRISVYGSNSFQFRAGFSVEEGDYVLIIPHRQNRMAGTAALGMRGLLFFRIGEWFPGKGQIMGSYEFFRAPVTGVPEFCVNIWTNLDTNGQPPFRTNTDFQDRFLVDIFVFAPSEVGRISESLSEIAAANREDQRLCEVISEIVGGEGQRILPSEKKKAGDEHFEAIKEAEGSDPIGPRHSLQMDPAGESDSMHLKLVADMGHPLEALSIAISGNNLLAASGGRDSSIRLWEVSTGREIRTLKGHAGPVSAVAFLPDSKGLVSGGWDGDVILWDLEANAPQTRIAVKDGVLNAISVHPSGRFVVTEGDRFELRVWDLASGELLRKCRGHSDTVLAITTSEDGRYILSGSRDQTVRLWDFQTGALLKTISGPENVVTAVAFSRKKAQVMTAGYDRLIRLWDLDSGELIRQLDGHTSAVTSMAYAHDDDRLVSCDTDGNLIWWDLKKKAGQKKVFYNLGADINSLAISSDSRFVYCATRSSGLYVLRGRPLSRNRSSPVIQQITKDRMHAGGGIVDVAINDDGHYAAVIDKSPFVSLWDMKTGKRVNRVRSGDASITCGVFRPGRRYEFFVGGTDGKPRLVNLKTGKVLRKYQGVSATINTISSVKDGSRFLATAAGKGVFWYDAEKDLPLRTFSGFSHQVLGASFLPGKNRVIGFSDAEIKIWNPYNGEEIEAVKGFSLKMAKDIVSGTLSADGRLLVTGHLDGSLCLWEVQKGKKVIFTNKVIGHSVPVTSIAIDHLSKRIASADMDGVIKTWVSRTTRCTSVSQGHEDAVSVLRFSKDGGWLVSGSRDSTSRYWDVINQKEVLRLISFDNGEWVGLTPDQFYISSPEGGPQLYWVPRGSNETFAFTQFERLCFNEDIVSKRLHRMYEGTHRTESIPVPPHLQLENHLGVVQTEEASCTIRLNSIPEEDLMAIRIYRNGRQVAMIERAEIEAEISVSIPLLSGMNRITTVAFDKQGVSSNPQWIDVLHESDESEKPALHVLAIGVSHYPNLPARWQLQFAHTDAKALLQVMGLQEGKMFHKVESRLLTNQQATRESICRELEALSEINDNDVAIVFMAGHGLKQEDGTFYFLASDWDLDGESSGGVDWALLERYLSEIHGRVVLFLDACHSGTIVTETVVPNDELARRFFENGRGGVMVLSASKGRQFSMESRDVGGGFGIFSYALVQALSNRSDVADTNDNGYVEMMEIVDYVQATVDKATHGEQTPWLSRQELFGDFPIASTFR
jgi:WD40 repeat protein